MDVSTRGFWAKTGALNCGNYCIIILERLLKEAFKAIFLFANLNPILLVLYEDENCVKNVGLEQALRNS